MPHIHTLLIGRPQTLTDERGQWRSAIFRAPVAGPVALQWRGLAGDQVADTRHHGSPDQAVCCHPLDHYTYWNDFYRLSTPSEMLRPGSVGENWTMTQLTEQDVYIGDIYRVGSARVQVSGPRYPCTKQERKVKLARFHRRTLETGRTGYYLRVLTPGIVQAGDEWLLEARPQPDLSVHQINVIGLHAFDPLLARKALLAPELSDGWKSILRQKLG
jgi:MOSC domain-containing protein YiiM